MKRRFVDQEIEQLDGSLVDEPVERPQRQILQAQPEVTAVARPRVSVTDQFVGESETFVDFLVTLDAPGLSTVTVTYNTVPYTASAGSNNDFINTSGSITFAPGETSKTVRVTLNPDATPEGIESFRLRLTGSTNADIVKEYGDTYIYDNDRQVGTPSLWVRDAHVDEASGKAVFVVSLGENGGFASASTVTLQYSTANGEAIAGSDFTAVGGTLSFAPGESVKTIEVPISNDSIAEGLERFTLTLSNANGATIGRSIALAQIYANDATPVAQPRINIESYVVAENQGFVDVLVTLSAPGQQQVSVILDNAQGSAGSFGTDYRDMAATLVFAPGETAKLVRFELIDDAIAEAPETFFISLRNATNGVIGNGNAVVNILDNDTLTATPKIYVSDIVVDEASRRAVFHITLGENGGQSSASAISVAYSTQALSATAGADFTAQSGSLVFLPGETLKTVVIDITNDTIIEGLERFQLNLSNPVGATLARGSAIAEIHANDGNAVAQPRINVTNYIVAENQGFVDVVVSLSAPGQQTVRVEYDTENVTAEYWSRADYMRHRGLLEFAPGETSKTIRIELTNDLIAESAESFDLVLFGASNAVIGQAKSNILILDNDGLQATPSIYVRDLVVDEASGRASFVVTLGKTGGQAALAPVSVDFATQALSATGGSDFVARSGSLVFQPGETMKTVVVDLVNDSQLEGLERFQLVLSNAVGGSIAQGTAIAEIMPNDGTAQALPRLSVNDLVVDESQGFLEFVVTLSAPGQQLVRVEYDTSDITAGYWNANDYVRNRGLLEFAPGETAKTVRIELTNDLVTESLESFRILLSSPVNAVIAKSQGHAWIFDNDNLQATPEIWVRDVSVDEKSGRATFIVSLGESGGLASNNAVSVDFRTVAGTATAGSDYVAHNGTLIFQPGETVKTVVVDLVDDSLREGLERFQIQLSNPIGATLGRASAQAEIGANDATAIAQPRLDVADYFVNEGQGYVDVVVTLNNPGQQLVRVEYDTADITANYWNVADYVSASGTLEFAIGETTKVVRISLSNDLVAESLESFNFVLRSPTNATIGDGIANIVVFDNDNTTQAPGLFVRGGTVDESAGTATFLVTLGENGSQASNGPVTVAYTTASDSASAGGDFVGRSGTLTFLPGETMKTVVVDLVDDADAEGRESFNLVLSNPTGGATLVQPVGQMVIGGSDGTVLAQPRLVTESTTGDETDGFVEVVVRLDGPSDRLVSVNWSLSSFSASFGNDFASASNGSLSFQPGETTKTVRIELLNDLVPEGQESFNFRLSNASNATINTENTRIFIADNDNVVSTPELHVQDLFVDESAGTATFVVSLGRQGGQSGNEEVRVDYATVDGSARAGLDYVARSGQLVFAPGESIKTVVVPLINDLLAEGNESFTLRLANPIGAVLADLSGQAMIGANDASSVAQPVLRLGGRVVAEGDGYVELLVQLSAPSTGDVTVSYQTLNGTAVAGSDFGSVNGSLRFAPGETLKVVRVEINDDINTETLESFQLRLFGLQGGSFGAGSPSALLATVDLADNDSVGIRVLAYGLGDDEYRLNSSTDVIIEGPDGGNDTVFSNLRSYTLPAYVENAVITTANAANVFGNDLDNLLVAGAGNNVLRGGGGIDTVSYQNSAAAVTVSLAFTVAQDTFGSGQDTISLVENLTGSAFADTLSGNTLWNVIDGGAGADTMSGGDGSDTYVVDNIGDLVIETNADVRTGGSDWVYTSLPGYTLGDNVENGVILRATGGNLFGNSLNNTLVAGAGDNRLSGGGGVDTASYVNAAAAVTVDLNLSGAQATGGSGTDTLSLIEGLIGSAFDDVLTGNALWNLLDGGAGADIMTGGAGSDTYVVDHLGDQVIETEAGVAGGSADTVYSRLNSYTLGNHVENGVIDIAGGATLLGNELDNQLVSGLGNDVLDGRNGLDTVSYLRAPTAVTVNLALIGPQTTGGSGIDTLISIENLIGSSWNDDLRGDGQANLIRGGSGSDVIRGGLGNDLLYGGPGNLGEGTADYFVFDTAPNGNTNYDRIFGFEGAGLDKIVLDPSVFAAIGATLDASEFRAGAGGNALDANDFILFDSQTGNLFYDADGSGAGSKVLFAKLVAWTGSIDASDFQTAAPPRP